MKRALITALVLALSSTAYAADNAEQASSLVDAIAAAKTGGERKPSVEKLLALDPMPVEALAKFLARDRKTNENERRAVLSAIHAAVPNKKGKFNTPRRQTKEDRQKADKFDWLAALGKKSHSEALGETAADVAAIRALAAAEDTSAGLAIFEFAFSEPGLIYRDECGRYLRKMSPWSLPALIQYSQAKKYSSERRYATYQLERLDRENPFKAIRYTTNEDLKIEIMMAMAKFHYREGVYPVLELVDNVSAKLRAGARAAWNEYVMGREPRPSPKRRISEPGGRMSKKKFTLWLNHRDLADIELRKLIDKLEGTPPAETATLEQMTKRVYAFYDKRRADKLDKMVTEAVSKSESGAVVEGAELMDEVLAQNPDHPRRGEAFGIYYDYAKKLEKDKNWREAAMAYAKAHAMSPEGEHAKQALAQHHYARGKAVEAEGGNASAEFARARDVDPNMGGGAAGGRKWMLYAGMGGGAAGLLLLAIGFAIRRR